jgi:predicted glycosyltransferase
VLIFRPLIRRMEERGHEVVVTSRDFAQTIGLLDRYGIPHRPMGAHGGGGLRGKARAMGSRSSQLAKMVRGEHFDLAVAHGSTDQPLVARLARIPQVTMFDYEFAAAMHHSNGRLATRVLVPDAIPERALARYGIRSPKLIRDPGLKEEYYLADDPPDPGVAGELGLDPGKVIVVLRPPPEVTLYHRGASTDLFAQVVDHLEAHADTVQVVALPRIDSQREALRERGVLVPEFAVDGPGLIAASDLVISAGGTMNPAVQVRPPRQYFGAALASAVLPDPGLPQDRHARIAARRTFVDLKQQFMAAIGSAAVKRIGTASLAFDHFWGLTSAMPDFSTACRPSPES